MKNIKTIVTVVSWEERFIAGIKLSIEKHTPENIVFFMFKGYEERNSQNLNEAKKICREKGVAFNEQYLDFSDPKTSWNTIRIEISSLLTGSEILLDITTMPRETIWSILFFLEQIKAKVNYIYYRPNEYNEDWLSRDPSEPRLLYRMSGICELGKPTLLFVFPGHDYQRISNLINCFEPHKLILACQKEEDKKSQEVAEKCIQRNNGNMVVEKFEFDTYMDPHGYEEIAEKVEENFREYNIIFSSLGPKISAISLYRINRAYPETALCYIPCKEFNIDYSKGILKNEPLTGFLEIPTRKHQLIIEY